MGHLIVTRASIHGFLAFDWWHRRDEAHSGFPIGNTRGKSNSRKMYWMGSSVCPKASFGC
jgi:hypothetical protein